MFLVLTHQVNVVININGFPLNYFFKSYDDYVHYNLHFKIHADLSFDDVDVTEPLSIEISRPHGKNIIGGGIYRPPNQRVGDFVSKHKDICKRKSLERTKYVLL